MEIPLTQGQVTVIDDEDYQLIRQYHWYAQRVLRSGCYYAMTYLTRPTPRAVGMHRIILDAPAGLCVDHINGNGLDNRRSNIRLCTQGENMRNRHRRSGKSRYKGVWWHKRDHRWMAHIRHQGKRIHLGRFVDEIDAALAYDKASRELFGEFAAPNFPLEVKP
jgi:hypothetical protein